MGKTTKKAFKKDTNKLKGEFDYGTERKWNVPKNLKSLINIPEGLDEYVNDIKVNVFEIAWLTDEQISKFTSDFKIVANFFVNKRKTWKIFGDSKK